MAKRNLRKCLLPLVVLTAQISAFAQLSSVQPNMIPATPPIEPGVSLDLAKWRAARYSDVRYKLNLTLEKMSPVLKGTMEIRVRVSSPHVSNGSGSEPGAIATGSIPPIILDWRKIKGHEEKSTISNVSVNGKAVSMSTNWPPAGGVPSAGGSDFNEHLIFSEGLVAGENVIKLDFTSPILTSGSAITRYVDKEDGSEYLYSLFVPSDASTAFPVFDQPDLKARFSLTLNVPDGWQAVSNTAGSRAAEPFEKWEDEPGPEPNTVTLIMLGWLREFTFTETKPISTYVFAFAAGPFERIAGGNLSGSEGVSSPPNKNTLPTGRVSASGAHTASSIYVRKSQAEKFKPHAAEVFRLNREAVKYFEEYFDYKFPFPKYDLVLIPEFPFGGMEHAGATFLRESSIIFPQEPTKNDHISRATLIFHEAAHQWFGDTVTMRWFDDLWLKEGFATFTAYKAMERIMPEMNAWKVFYERVKQAAYQTDSTKGTTPIYQEIPNLSAAKSAYGNIVYNKAPAFLRQAEFYLGEEKFRTAVRSFLKKQEFGNAGWEDLVREFETASKQDLKAWANVWVRQPGLPTFRVRVQRLTGGDGPFVRIFLDQTTGNSNGSPWAVSLRNRVEVINKSFGERDIRTFESTVIGKVSETFEGELVYFTGLDEKSDVAVFPNAQDYGYGIFLLDEKSREYVLKNIQNERDPFLRSMMWGALWDSVREGELDPRVYVETVLSKSDGFSRSKSGTPKGVTLTEDESTTALLLNRVGTAMNYYLSEPPASAGGQSGSLRSRVEDLLIERMRNAETLGQRITYYRAFLNIAASENARSVLKQILVGKLTEKVSGERFRKSTRKVGGFISWVDGTAIPLKTKDRFDIVTRLLILGDPDGERLLAELEKAETSDDAKRYAYAARAGIATAANKAKYWNDFVNNKEISESWIEAAFGPWNSIRHADLTLPYLERALKELPNHKRNRKIFFVNGWLGAFIGGQRSEEALNVINKFLADNATLDKDLRLKILENADVIERAVKIRKKV